MLDCPISFVSDTWRTLHDICIEHRKSPSGGYRGFRLMPGLNDYAALHRAFAKLVRLAPGRRRQPGSERVSKIEVGRIPFTAPLPHELSYQFLKPTVSFPRLELLTHQIGFVLQLPKRPSPAEPVKRHHPFRQDATESRLRVSGNSP